MTMVLLLHLEQTLTRVKEVTSTFSVDKVLRTHKLDEHSFAKEALSLD
jgi:hypothetical protein